MQPAGAPPASDGADDEPLEWRNQVALRLVRALAVASALAFVLVLLMVRGSAARAGLVATAILSFAGAAVPALTGRPSGPARHWVIVIPVLFASISGYAFAGFLSGPGVCLAVSLMLTGLLLGRRAMIGASVVCLVIISAIGWAIVNGHLTPPNPTDHDMTRAVPWVRTIGVTFLAITAFGAFMVAIVNRMERAVRLARQETRLREQAERDRAEAQRAALESKQLEVIGRLAAGVAHDFNNSLTAIMGSAELLQLELPEHAQGRDLADSILQSSRHLAELTRQLLAYSRKAHMVKTPTDLNALVDEALSLVRRSISPNVKIVLKLAASPATVSADVTMLQSALLNLLVNASDAMPDGGTLTVATTSVILSADAAAGKGLAPGPSLLLEVLDTGRGIAPDLLGHIFDPFFTTKPIGRGTGLGLAAVAGTIKALGGRVEVESDVGVGSAFRIYLPSAEPRAAAALAAGETIVHGEGHILLVDDDAMVSLTATATLESLGYRVTRCEDGHRALELVRAQPRAFDLVLLDLRMPGLSGEATFTRLRELAPELRVLIWSGYVDEQDVGGMLARGAVGFLQKPYRVSELSRAIASALGSRGSQPAASATHS
jgi:signal transduction histidine kinase/ActR/RegA family two-component response regulator